MEFIPRLLKYLSAEACSQNHIVARHIDICSILPMLAKAYL